MIKNFVFSGGEMMGLCYIGVLKYLEEESLLTNIENMLGISIGSLFCALYCMRFNSEQIKKIAMSIDIAHLSDSKNHSFFTFLETYGIDSGLNIEKFFKIVIKKKLGNENATFKDLNNAFPNPKLLIGGSNINKNLFEIYSYDTTPDMYIWEALRISCSIPILFPAVKRNDDILVDGGILNNYPINYFKDDLEHTIGIVLKRPNECREEPITTVDKYLLRILKHMIYSFQNYLETQFEANTIKLIADYCLFDMNFSIEARTHLIESGYKQFKEQYENKYKKTSNSNITLDKLDNTHIVSDKELDKMIDDIQSIISENNTDCSNNIINNLQNIISNCLQSNNLENELEKI
jgi:predicted acylesterase/phospholipase RssA